MEAAAVVVEVAMVAPVLVGTPVDFNDCVTDLDATSLGRTAL